MVYLLKYLDLMIEGQIEESFANVVLASSSPEQLKEMILEKLTADLDFLFRPGVNRDTLLHNLEIVTEEELQRVYDTSEGVKVGQELSRKTALQEDL